MRFVRIDTTRIENVPICIDEHRIRSVIRAESTSDLSLIIDQNRIRIRAARRLVSVARYGCADLRIDGEKCDALRSVRGSERTQTLVVLRLTRTMNGKKFDDREFGFRIDERMRLTIRADQRRLRKGRRRPRRCACGEREKKSGRKKSHACLQVQECTTVKSKPAPAG